MFDGILLPSCAVVQQPLVRLAYDVTNVVRPVHTGPVVVHAAMHPACCTLRSDPAANAAVLGAGVADCACDMVAVHAHLAHYAAGGRASGAW